MPQYFHHASLISQSAISLLLFIQPTRPHSRPYIRVMPFDWQPTKKKKKLKTKKERDRVRSLKDEPKKPAAADRPVSDPHACEKKPILTGHQQAHAKQEKVFIVHFVLLSERIQNFIYFTFSSHVRCKTFLITGCWIFYILNKLTRNISLN